MYAIRSYYGKSEAFEGYEENGEWDEDINYQTTVNEKENTIKKVFEMLGEKCVITSYSIHYTKLYEFSSFLT